MRRLIAFFVLLAAPLLVQAQQTKTTNMRDWNSTKPQRLLLTVKPLAGNDAAASNDLFSGFSDAMMSTRCAVVSVKNGVVSEKEILISHKSSERHFFAIADNVTVWVEKSYITTNGKSTVVYTLVGGGYFE